MRRAVIQRDNRFGFECIGDKVNPILYIVAIPTFGLLLAAVWAVWIQPRENPVQTRLQTWIDWERQQALVNLPPRSSSTRKAMFASTPNPAFLPKLGRMLAQVRSPYNVATFLLLSLVICLGSGVLVSFFTNRWLQIVIVALVGGLLPYAVLLYKKNQYFRQIEKQLPQALDMLAQSLWAGHTIQTGIRIIGEDFEEPLCTEFRRTAEAIEFGVPLPTALDELATRVEIADLRFFITSVLVQRETGGNLAEIITRTSNVIRERLEFQDRIRALSAEGKLSAYILFIIPLAMAVYFYFSDPKHFDIIFSSQSGTIILIGTAIWMLIGMLVIQWMIKLNA